MRIVGTINWAYIGGGANDHRGGGSWFNCGRFLQGAIF